MRDPRYLLSGGCNLRDLLTPWLTTQQGELHLHTRTCYQCCWRMQSHARFGFPRKYTTCSSQSRLMPSATDCAGHTGEWQCNKKSHQKTHNKEMLRCITCMCTPPPRSTDAISFQGYFSAAGRPPSFHAPWPQKSTRKGAHVRVARASMAHTPPARSCLRLRVRCEMPDVRNAI
jgi:hypothetical protein